MSGTIPPPPPGFALITDNAIPPPPPGFTLIEEPRPPTGLERAGRFADNVVRQVARGATLGFADELAAGARSLGGADYSAALAEERTRDRQFEQENPLTAIGAQFAGGVLSPVARLVPGGQATTLPQAVGRGAVAGATVGGATGFGEGEGGFMPRVVNAAQSAALGGAIGGALPVATAAGTAIARRVGRALGLSSPQANAERIILRDLERDGVTPQEVAARAREPGPTAIADLGGENVRGTAAFVARAPGSGRQAAMDLVTARGGDAQRQRLAEAVRGGVSGDDFADTVGDVIAARARQAAPLYDAAYAQPLPASPTLDRLIRNPNVRRGIADGIELIRNEADAAGTPFDLAAFGVRMTPDGPELIPGATSTRIIDAAKRGLDQAIEASRATGRATPQTRSLVQLQRALLDEADRLNPAFAQARAAYAGQSELIDAAALGREMLSMRPAEWAERLADVRAMSPQQRDFLRLGLAREMLDRIAATNDPQELTRINRLLGSDQARERVRAAFDSPAEFGRFMREFAREAEIARTNQVVSPRAGSQTQPLQERGADLAAPPPGPLGQAVVRPDPNAPPSPLQALTMPNGGFLPMARAGMQALDRSAAIRDREALAPLLFNADPTGRQAAAERLLSRAVRDEALRRALTPALQGAARGGAVVTATD